MWGLCQNLIPLPGWIIPPCKCQSHFVYPFFCEWMLKLYPPCLLRVMLQWIWIYKYVFWLPVFTPLGYIPRRGIAGSYGNSLFNLFWGASILSSTAAAPLHIHQLYYIHQCIRILFLYLLTDILFSVFLFVFMKVFLMNVKQYFIVVLICISS